MRRLLPFALLLAACAKPADPPAAGVPVATAKPSVTADTTPLGMAKTMDVPFYPGAEAPDGLSTTPEKRDDGSTHYSLVLATKDPVEKVAAWYAKATDLPSLAGMGGKNIIGKSPKGNDLIIIVAPEAGRTLIRLRSVAYAK